MNELVQLGDKTYVLKNVVNVGFYLINDRDICLIDTGNSSDSAKIINKIIEEKEWNLKCIINTHGHADHIGGNKYLQDKYNCKIYANKLESYFINDTFLEPTILYGANPLKDLCNPFLMAKPSKCNDIEELNINGISILNLSGHTAGLIGVVTSDNVCFVGDAYTSEKILNKYAIQYVFDVDKFLETLEFLKTTNYCYYVPSHGEIEKNLSNTLEINRNVILKIERQILENVSKEQTFNEILEKLCNIYHIKINLIQYYLIGGTLKAFLTKLENDNKITIIFENGNLIICKK